MSLNLFIEEHAIGSIDELSTHENQNIWLLISNNIGNNDYHTAKIKWSNGGVYDIDNKKYILNTYDPNMIYFCQNQSNSDEYFSIYDFMPNLNGFTSFNSIYTNEDDIDSIISTLSLIRTKTSEKTQKILDDIISNRGFSISINEFNPTNPEVIEVIELIKRKY